MTLYEDLNVFLKNLEKLAIICVGNDLRGDDAVGIMIHDELMKILGNEDELNKFMENLKPEPFVDPTKITPEVTAAAQKQIQTITGAAPKTFNINIEKLVENFEVITENLTEGSEDIKRKIALTLAEALADVQPITD